MFPGPPSWQQRFDSDFFPPFVHPLIFLFGLLPNLCAGNFSFQKNSSCHCFTKNNEVNNSARATVQSVSRNFVPNLFRKPAKKPKSSDSLEQKAVDPPESKEKNCHTFFSNFALTFEPFCAIKSGLGYSCVAKNRA